MRTNAYARRKSGKWRRIKLNEMHILFGCYCCCRLSALSFDACRKGILPQRCETCQRNVYLLMFKLPVKCQKLFHEWIHQHLGLHKKQNMRHNVCPHDFHLLEWNLSVIYKQSPLNVSDQPSRCLRIRVCTSEMCSTSTVCTTRQPDCLESCQVDIESKSIGHRLFLVVLFQSEKFSHE